MIFGEIMRWREGDGRRERAEIISRKVVTQTDAWWFKALFNVRLRKFYKFEQITKKKEGHLTMASCSFAVKSRDFPRYLTVYCLYLARTYISLNIHCNTMFDPIHDHS